MLFNKRGLTIVEYFWDSSVILSPSSEFFVLKKILFIPCDKSLGWDVVCYELYGCSSYIWFVGTEEWNDDYNDLIAGVMAIRHVLALTYHHLIPQFLF